MLLGIILGLLIFLALYRLIFDRNPKFIPDFNESDAEGFLQKNGFSILSRQKSAPLVVIIDGKTHLGKISADFEAEKLNKKYIVKVVSQADVDVMDPISYRKFIELKKAYPLHALLLLGLNRRELHEIDFEFPKPEKETFFTILVVLSIILAVGAIIALMAQLKLF
ncbi:hypothetical protein HZC34_03315 [Candidatus Saganbacteria bacterium]|nr:hypothetical protein [Candidatus Saganbacteria bacterium]